MWDTENSPGPSKAQNELISQFEQKYPNVTVDRTVKNFDDYMATIKLAASSENAPDVFQGNEGSVDQTLVKAHLIVPLDSLAKAYGWDDRFGSPAALNPLRWSADGQHWGTGKLWGIAQKAEVLGVFYNKATMKRLGIKVPTTFAEFEQSLAAAKAGGVPPIMVGNLDRWPMGHVFMVLQSRFDDPTAIANWTYGRPGATFDTPAPARPPRSSSSGVPRAISRTASTASARPPPLPASARARGLYFITGPWENQTFAGPLKDGVGFFPLPSVDGSARCAHHWRAVAPVPHQRQVAEQGGGRGVHQLDHRPARGRHRDLERRPAGGHARGRQHRSQVVAGSRSRRPGARSRRRARSRPTSTGRRRPWATRCSAGSRQLSEGKVTPDQFAAAVQEDWEKAHS